MSRDLVTAEWLTSFLDRWDSALCAGDAEALCGMCASDVVFDDSGVERVVIGRGMVQELLASVFSRVRYESITRLDEFIAEDGRAAAAIYQSYRRSSPDADLIGDSSIDFFEFEDGVVTRWVTYVRDPDWLGTQYP